MLTRIRPRKQARSPHESSTGALREGRYHGRVAIPIAVLDGMPLLVRGDRIYAVTLNDAGVPQVVRSGHIARAAFFPASIRGLARLLDVLGSQL